MIRLPPSRRRIWWLRFLLLAALFLGLLGSLGYTVFRGVSAQRYRTPAVPGSARTIPNTDINPFGANFFLAREVEPWKLDRTLQMAADAGIGWVKQQFPWEEIEPQRKGEYLDPATKSDSWAKFDRIVDACGKHGLQIVARLDRPPPWTRQDNTYGQRPPDDLADYGDFVYAFVTRYKGRIRYIQIWNEPNIFPEWGNRPVDPEAYVALLKVAYRRAKEADPNVYVLSAPLAMTLGQPHPEPDQWISMSDLLFLERMYQAGAREFFDIHSANAFGMDRSPEDPPNPNVLNFQRVLLQREIMERHGDADKGVWFNEYGWNAAPAAWPAERLIWQRVTEAQQSEYTLQGIDMARREWPWAGAFMIWYFRQVGNMPPDEAEAYFRVVDVDFTPRQVYFALQNVTQSPSVAGPGQHQETSPSIKADGDWRYAIDPSARSGAYAVSSRQGDSVTLTFSGTGLDLISRQWQGAGRLVATLDGRGLSNLPIDSQGHSYVELYGPIVEAQARIPLVRDAPPGEHTLRLTVASTRHTAATGSECIVDAFEVLAHWDRAFPWALVLALLAGLALVGWLLYQSWIRLRPFIR
jgi:hypothetical protein